MKKINPIAQQAPKWRELGRLRGAVETLQRASIRSLRDIGFVADIIRHAGLAFDARGLYGRDNRFMNQGPFGLWQIPSQLAACLVELSQYEIASMVEIGTWSGWTVTIMAAYLRCFQPQLHVTTVDLGHCWDLRNRVISPMVVHIGTSADLKAHTFDLAFLDGDHAYDACAADYENVGRKAAICMFHDINDEYVSAYEPNFGGVPRLWTELKSHVDVDEQTIEYLDHSEGRNVMGIGLLVKSRAKRRPREPERQSWGWLCRTIGGL